MVDLNSLDFGEDGIPVIILHGLFGSGRNWASIAKQIAGNHRVHCLDARNHGDSPWDDGMDYEDMAEDVRQFLDAADYDNAVVMGHSMGGKIAMALALNHPERVRDLIVVDMPPAPNETSDFRGLVKAMKQADLAGIERRADLDDQLSDAIPDATLRAFLLQNVKSVDGGLEWRVNLDVIDRELERLLGWPADLDDKHYPGPTLFIPGETSDYIRDDHTPTIHRLFPQAKIDPVPGAGHWPHAAKPREFLERVMGFLKNGPAA